MMARAVGRRIVAAWLVLALAGGLLAPAYAGRGDAPDAPDAPAPPAPPHAHAHASLPRPPRAPRAPRVRVDADDDEPRVNVDTVFVVQPGTKLEVFNFNGSVALHTWSKNAVRLAVERPANDRIAIERAGQVMKFESISSLGTPGDMDFDLVVPPWLPVSLSGVNNDVTAEGLTGGLSVDTVHGDIVARHLSGPIVLHSVEGVVDLADAHGSIDVGSVNDAVRLSDVAGAIVADGVNGDVHLVGVDSRKVSATSVSGDVIFDSPMLDGGDYRFQTHTGDIAVGLADAANATVSVSTFSGDFASAFAIRPERLERAERGKRMRFTLGNGSAKLNLESFAGSIEILRANQRELRQRMNDVLKARRDALKKWGEWNPQLRMEWKRKVDKAEAAQQRVMERSMERGVEHDLPDTTSDE
jgi:hypothetical protein